MNTPAPIAARDYQDALDAKVDAAYAGNARAVLMVLPTGGGKTFMISRRHFLHNGASALIAHRQELTGQLSLALAQYGVRHNLIASSKVRHIITQAHIDAYGRSYYDPSSRHGVCGIDTLVRATDQPAVMSWARQVTLGTVDEGHHVVHGNKWDTGLKLFTHPDLRLLLPTASPTRADGKGLGRHADGVCDAMVEGPKPRELIEDGWLNDYRYVGVDSDLEILGQVAASGDYSNQQLKEAAKRSHIVGDVVKVYQQYAAGLLTVVFATDVDTATAMAVRFRQAGIAAECLTGDTDPLYRRQVLQSLAARRITVLVAIDIISEGFDLPAVECGIMARPTASLGLYLQQFGRILRPVFPKDFDANAAGRAGRLATIAAGPKPKAMLIDMVGNLPRHLPPDWAGRVWTLDRRGSKRGKADDAIKVRVCGSGWTRERWEAVGLPDPCFQVFEWCEPECPFCGFPLPEPGTRSSPAAVDGDLSELDTETLDRLRSAVMSTDMSLADYKVWLTQAGVPSQGYAHHVKRHEEVHQAQTILRSWMDHWAAARRADGWGDRKIQRGFHGIYGVDVLSAQSLGQREAMELATRIRDNG